MTAELQWHVPIWDQIGFLPSRHYIRNLYVTRNSTCFLGIHGYMCRLQNHEYISHLLNFALICLLYVSYHISVKKHRGLFRLELALWTRIAVFLYACYMCHILFLSRNTGNRFTWNWLYEPLLRLNKRLSKQCRRRRFETPSRSLWRHCNIVLKLNFDSSCLYKFPAI